MVPAVFPDLAGVFTDSSPSKCSKCISFTSQFLFMDGLHVVFVLSVIGQFPFAVLVVSFSFWVSSDYGSCPMYDFQLND